MHLREGQQPTEAIPYDAEARYPTGVFVACGDCGAYVQVATRGCASPELNPDLDLDPDPDTAAQPEPRPEARSPEAPKPRSPEARTQTRTRTRTPDQMGDSELRRREVDATRFQCDGCACGPGQLDETCPIGSSRHPGLSLGLTLLALGRLWG